MVIVLPVLVVAMGAIFALLIVMGGASLGKLVGAVLDGTVGRIPFIGSILAGGGEAAYWAAWGLVNGWLSGATREAASWVRALYRPLWSIATETIHAIRAAQDRLWLLGAVILPEAIAKLAFDVAGWVDNAITIGELAVAKLAYSAAGWVANAIAIGAENVAKLAYSAAGWVAAEQIRAEEDVAHLAYSAAGWVAAETLRAEADTARLAYSAAGWVAAETIRAEADTARLAYTAAEWVAGAEERATAEAAAAFSGAVSTVYRDATGELARVYDDLTPVVQGVLGDITQQYPGSIAGAQTWPEALPTDLAGVLGAVLAMTVPLTVEAKECGIPNCRDLGKFPRELAGLENVVSLAGLMGLTAAGIADPTDTANVIVDVAYDTLDALIHGTAVQLGLR